ncbi:hypothetical protein [Chromohalobacter sp. HP20-39]|uniref:hypothetical protein n=1 Tax=Chromohalobacter sp. HP20-39 TaxID=3079306 RepID=UPI00294B2F73|nr:hypothetical protein [Chromohalobacter sp. HP20-39]MDV6318773.1 hypothetical protein [Chromohalobacter sp. HP20-39]
MLSYLTDRRHKPEEQQLRNLVKPRFTDAEIEEIEQEAAMHFGGKLAPAVREYALLGMEVARQRRHQLIERLASGAPTDEADRQELAQLLAGMAERSLSDTSIDKRDTA